MDTPPKKKWHYWTADKERADGNSRCKIGELGRKTVYSS